MENEIFFGLVDTSLVLACAIVLVLIVRLPLRRQFGARLAYHGWLIIPAALAAMMLPVTRAVQRPLSLPLAALHVAGGQGVAIQAESHVWMHVLLAFWLAGLMASVIFFLSQHRRFLRELGELKPLAAPLDGTFAAVSAQSGPALLGFLRPRIIVPADFESRYTAQEQALIVAHENIHKQRGDALANALFCLMQCGFWFNPLIHVAASRFRFDQELACDATVMLQHPESRRSYADAMLKTQMATAITPVGCHWQSSHPLKERVMNLNRSAPRALRRAAGMALIASMLGVSGYSAWAAQAPEAPGVTTAPAVAADARTFQANMTIKDASGSFSAVVLTKEGDVFNVANGDTSLAYSFKLTDATAESVKVWVTVRQGDKILTKPRLVVGWEQPGRIESRDDRNPAGSFEIKLVASPVKAPEMEK